MICLDTNSTVYHDVLQERIRQDDKWGIQNHNPVYWLSILGEEFGEVCKAFCDSSQDTAEMQHYREELVQVAAVAISAIECFDRGNRVSW